MPVPPPYFLTRSPPKYATYIHPGRRLALREMKRGMGLLVPPLLGFCRESTRAASSLSLLEVSANKHVRAGVGCCAPTTLRAREDAGNGELPTWLATGTRSQKTSGQALHAPGSGRYTCTQGGPSWSGSEVPQLGMWPS